MVSLLFFIASCSSGAKTDSEKGKIPAVEIKARTDRTSATIGQSITYMLSAFYDPAIEIHMPEVGSQIAGLRIVDFGEEGPRQIDNRLEYKKWYTLQADIVGAYIIPSLKASYKDKDGTAKELKTPQIFIEVKSVLKDETGLAPTDIVDIKPLQRIEQDLTLYVLSGLAALVIILAVIGILFYINRKQKRARENKRPAHVVALEELEKLQKEKLIEKGVVKEHYFRLSDIFRNYIENRFSIPAVEQTTQELLPEIAKHGQLSTAVKSKTRAFLIHSDLIKFAKYVPAQDEVDHSHADIKTVINETKQEETVIKEGQTPAIQNQQQ